jgi:diguanylate cyclase (GGDEF)-like protein/putative nucleotidyltransferase with HDIG domain
MVSRVLSPTAGDVGMGEFGIAVRHMWLGLAAVAWGGLAANLVADSFRPPDLVVAVLATSLAAACRLRLRERRWFAEAALLLAVLLIGATVATGDSDRATAAALLLAWPLVLAGYFAPLTRAMVLVAIAGSTLAADLLLRGHHDGAIQRLVVTLVVFGGMTPLVSMVRLRGEMSVKYLKEAAIRDPLTGLLNRRGFEAAFAETLAAAELAGTHVSLIMADVDYFKTVNDRHGHGAGDQLLGEVSTLLLLGAPTNSVVARVGGEEFAIILDQTALEVAFTHAEELRLAVESTFGRTATRVTMSLGIVATDLHGHGLDTLVQHADKALYAAKELGRNRAVGYSDDVIEVLERARIRREEASRNQLATLLTLAEALDLRDASTALHSRTVADYAEGMARELGLEADLVERIRLAGLLHDIGKIGVPDSVLLHPGKLDDEQWELMRQHPEIGARMLNHVDYTDIRDWVLAHHERFDGYGYPAKLVGEQIPLAARILAVADSYEAMTADRVYRASLGHEFARGELRTCSGSQFDPDVVAAMERFLDATGIGMAEPGPQEPPATAINDEDDEAMPLAA